MRRVFALSVVRLVLLLYATLSSRAHALHFRAAFVLGPYFAS